MAEIEYLAELMARFPVEGAMSPPEAHDVIQTRYLYLAKLTLYDLTPNRSVEILVRLPNLFHFILYKEILSNAGLYRQPYDANAGEVWFGADPNGGPPRYRGIAPERIAPQLHAALCTLWASNDRPVAGAFRFYQRFVQIHPFYDANGRIGRLMVSLYLDNQGYYVNWEGFSATTRWLKRLNACHDRYGQPLYETYLVHFVAYAQKHVIPKDTYELEMD